MGQVSVPCAGGAYSVDASHLLSKVECQVKSALPLYSEVTKCTGQEQIKPSIKAQKPANGGFEQTLSVPVPFRAVQTQQK